MSYLTDLARKTPSVVEVRGPQNFEEVLNARLARRSLLKGGLGLTMTTLLGSAGLVACSDDDDDNGGSAPTLDYAVKFTAVPKNVLDTVTVPAGYVVSTLLSAGDAVEAGASAFNGAFQTSVETERQAGGNHDGMHFYPIPGVDPQQGGLLAINHEYPDFNILFAGGTYDAVTATPEQKRIALSAVGVSIVEVKRGNDGNWSVVANSPYNKRYTGNSLYNVTGLAASVVGPTIVGMLNNCASGETPWGTYLTCEESTDNYLDPTQPEEQYGWVVEVDPLNELPGLPAKHTAMGRFDHENTAYLLGSDNKVAIYMGHDGTPGCIYKFIPSGSYNPSNRASNAGLLSEGTLYVARFNADGTGEWIALIQGQNGLVAGAVDPGNKAADNADDVTVDFNTQADVLINTISAARVAGGTVMDRPEWITVGLDKALYCTLTNNSGRGSNSDIDEANPRKSNRHGHIIKWVEAGNSPTATSFEWDIVLLAGDPSLTNADGNLVGDIVGDTFSSPDGLRVDPKGRLWVQTDMSVPGDSGIKKGDGSTLTNVEVFGHNSMYFIDAATRKSQRFLVGPVGCEITGLAYTPDLTTFFINIQHPTGAWPSASLPPRSSTIVVRRSDGQPIGA